MNAVDINQGEARGQAEPFSADALAKTNKFAMTSPPTWLDWVTEVRSGPPPENPYWIEHITD